MDSGWTLGYAEARVVVAFWGQMTSDARERGALGRVREFTELTQAALARGQEHGEVRADTPIPLVARQLDSLYAGEQVILAADTASSSPEESLAIIRLCLAPWLTPLGHDVIDHSPELTAGVTTAAEGESSAAAEGGP